LSYRKRQDGKSWALTRSSLEADAAFAILQVIFELAILRLFSTSDSNDTKAVYMAPTKALTSERAADWKRKFEQLGLGWTVAELTGDTAPGPDVWKSIKRSRLIVTTPEKWDSITRSW
jgi:ATP-dependent DNA helicase HFM1/MER3